MLSTIDTRPSWQTEDDDALWERVKSAFRRDWKRVSRELNARRFDVDQSDANCCGLYDESAEPAYRFGYVASHHFGSVWNQELEQVLRENWNEESEWRLCRDAVRRGYEYGQNQYCDTHVFFDER